MDLNTESFRYFHTVCLNWIKSHYYQAFSMEDENKKDSCTVIVSVDELQNLFVEHTSNHCQKKSDNEKTTTLSEEFKPVDLDN